MPTLHVRVAVMWGAVTVIGCASADPPGVGGSDTDGGGGDGRPAVDARAGTPDARSGDAAAPIDAVGPVAADAAVGRCGDGRIDTTRGEVCDDGGTTGGDGCAADCLSVECTRPDSIEDPATHHCYWRETTVTSRGSAAATCASRGGYLVRWTGAVAEAAAIYTVVLGNPGGRVWIGLTRVGGTWTWDDGTAATVGADANFRSGEPSGDGDCAEWGSSNSLNDVPCSVSRDFVCERAPAGA